MEKSTISVKFNCLLYYIFNVIVVIYIIVSSIENADNEANYLFKELNNTCKDKNAIQKISCRKSKNLFEVRENVLNSFKSNAFPDSTLNPTYDLSVFDTPKQTRVQIRISKVKIPAIKLN